MSERRERLGRVAREALVDGWKSRLGWRGQDRTLDTLSDDDQEDYFVMAEAVAAAVDAEYASLLEVARVIAYEMRPALPIVSAHGNTVCGVPWENIVALREELRRIETARAEG